ncbi:MULTISPECIES: SirB1 family protein [Cyanophyceae]|uniref:Tetratricopeptide repeat protein n=1 Tax=Leptolyngbya subtilissima DQ-A4 TaxID=2933933 RepID=A0ABV0K4N1_9CYAN|nr:tetratricopeptide repeat protein [Nodosilinea sp. FACHB-141]MBD2112675.1 tetratricopeptide repeat protein [Nodosilinea sp. FACHB-141]
MTHSALSRERLYQELQRPTAQVSLARAALYIAQEDYPHLVVDDYLAMLDRMAETLRQRLPQDRYPLKIIGAINDYLFSELNFSGNSVDYYDPRNSFLNDVLERRVGIPITLSLVYLELADRIGFPMAGVSMPGHFLIRPTVNEMDVFVDPFNRGEIMFEQDCRERLKQMFGDPTQLEPQHLSPITPATFLVRILTNLKLIYLQNRDVPKALDAINRILLIAPEAVGEWRDRGLIHYQQGLLDQARLDLERYLHQHPNAGDAFEIRRVIEQIERVQDEP